MAFGWFNFLEDFFGSNLVFDIIYPTIERIKDFVMINRPATV